MITGNIIKIAGPVIVGNGMKGTQMHEMVKVGNDSLIGEIIELEGDTSHHTSIRRNSRYETR